MAEIHKALFLMLGLISVILFHAGIYFPISISVLCFMGLSLFFLNKFRKDRLGLLMLVFWLVYALPFIHIPPYIWFDFDTNPLLLWGLAVNPYMVDERVIRLTAMIGAVGGLGFALGCSSNNKKILKDSNENPDDTKPIFRTMEIHLWMMWIGVGILLTTLSAPQETVFTAAYTESASALDNANFSSAWMLSYVILTFPFCDALLERSPGVKRIKMLVILASIIIVVFWYQLLRGDRESLPWVFGLAIVYYYWAANITQSRGFTIPWIKITGTALGILVVTMVVGIVRSSLAGVSASEAMDVIAVLYQSHDYGLNNLFTGTWSAVLLTPLSVAGDHINGLMKLKWGQDYLNLLLSTIPGFMADAIGYVRPINSNQGPAWEMRYGIGGTHASVVPFMNFSMLGVFLITAFWSWFFSHFERSTLRRLNVSRLSFLAIFVMAAPHWLWYGEKSGVNALVMWVAFSFLYRVSIGFFGMSRVPRLTLDASIKRFSVDA